MKDTRERVRNALSIATPESQIFIFGSLWVRSSILNCFRFEFKRYKYDLRDLEPIVCQNYAKKWNLPKLENYWKKKKFFVFANFLLLFLIALSSGIQWWLKYTNFQHDQWTNHLKIPKRKELNCFFEGFLFEFQFFLKKRWKRQTNFVEHHFFLESVDQDLIIDSGVW